MRQYDLVYLSYRSIENNLDSLLADAYHGDGSSLGHDDPATKSGLEVKAFCKNVIKALDNKAWETYFGRKEKLGVHLKRLSQKLLHAVVIRSNVR